MILTAVEKEETVGGKETGEVEKIGPDWQTGSNIKGAMLIAKKIYKIRHNGGNSVKHTLKSIIYNHICQVNHKMTHQTPYSVTKASWQKIV